MWTFSDLIQNFFTHKDFLPGADKIPGTMFTPLHFLFSAICICLVSLCCLHVRRKSEKTMRTVFAVVWVAMVVLEVTKITWETFTGATVNFEWTGVLPLYPCSVFMYAMPFAIWGKGNLRTAGCGYVCSLGLLGGCINFVYPATILGNYSCISFAGFHTFFYHGCMVFCALTMLLSGYHSYTGVTRWQQLLLPACPALAVSVIANLVNYSPLDADYMLFKLRSFIFAPIGAATGNVLATVIVYIAYLIVHALPYLPSYIANRRKQRICS